jgi:hypothetical protein
MTLESVSKATFGVSHETIVRRILATFDKATPSDLESGATWYNEAGTLAENMAGAHHMTVEQTASVLAALSPRTTWSRNVIGAAALLNGGADAARRVGCIGANVERAVRCVDQGYAGLGNGPKTHAFARNIAGDREAVTVDVWACRVADLDETRLGRKGAYDAVAHAYRVAARRRGVDPATMQATTWVVARNGRAA